MRPLIEQIAAAIRTSNLTTLAAILTAFAAVIVTPFVAIRIARRQIRAQTISANREAWINSLRDELSEFLSVIFRIQRWDNVVYPDQREFHDLRQKLVLFQSKIRLRLNPKETDHIQLMNLLDAAVTAAVEGEQENQKQARSISEKIVMLSQEVLKREWKRVKEGE